VLVDQQPTNKVAVFAGKLDRQLVAAPMPFAGSRRECIGDERAVTCYGEPSPGTVLGWTAPDDDAMVVQVFAAALGAMEHVNITSVRDEDARFTRWRRLEEFAERHQKIPRSSSAS
jgi:hypothetical protein